MITEPSKKYLEKTMIVMKLCNENFSIKTQIANSEATDSVMNKNHSGPRKPIWMP